MPKPNNTYTGHIVREEDKETLVVIATLEGEQLALVDSQILLDAGVKTGFFVSMSFNAAGQPTDMDFTPCEVERTKTDTELENILKAAEAPLPKLR